MLIRKRAGIFLKWQGKLVHVMSWHQPALTLSVLFITTYLCFFPYIIICLPIIYMLTSVMAPNFDKRHPRPADTLPTKYFHRTGLGAEAIEFEIEELELSRMRQRKENSEKALLELVRDLQNCLHGLVTAIESFEAFIQGLGSFRNEERSSALYLLLLGGLITIIYIASFIPSHIAICGLIWAAVVSNHPKLRKKSKKGTKKLPKKADSKFKLFSPEWFKAFVQSEIIIDEKPETKLVEIFELERQGLTPRQWSPWSFSPLVYELLSPLRVSESRPPGSRFLSDVKPPAGWFFVDSRLSGDSGDEWYVDTEVKAWVAHRAIRCVELELDGAWAYDYSEESRGEWRRRRWLRRCYRYAAH